MGVVLYSWCWQLEVNGITEKMSVKYREKVQRL